jgi:hypothetical protein
MRRIAGHFPVFGRRAIQVNAMRSPQKVAPIRSAERQTPALAEVVAF